MLGDAEGSPERRNPIWSDSHPPPWVYCGYMKETTVKVSVATRDRIRALGGATHEDTIIEALDALEAERFWSQAESAKLWFDNLSPEEQRRLRAEDAAVDAAFRGL